MSEYLIFNEFFKDKILKIELNNLSKKNALSLEMLTEMALKLSQNNYIKKFRCVVITGTKKSAFSSDRRWTTAHLARAPSADLGLRSLRTQTASSWRTCNSFLPVSLPTRALHSFWALCRPSSCRPLSTEPAQSFSRTKRSFIEYFWRTPSLHESRQRWLATVDQFMVGSWVLVQIHGEGW